MLTSGNVFKIIIKGQAFGIVDSTNLAPVEETQYASRPYNQGEQLLYQGILCTATTDISIDTEFVISQEGVVEGNLVAVKVSEQLKELDRRILELVEGLAEVNDKIDNYAIPIATRNELGGVKIGSGINVDDDGKISAQSYTLPTATSSTKGGIKVSGRGLQMDGEFIKLGRIYYNSTSASVSGWNIGGNSNSEKEISVYNSTLAKILYEGKGCVYGVESSGVRALSIESISPSSQSYFNIRLACNNADEYSINIDRVIIRYWYFNY